MKKNYESPLLFKTANIFQTNLMIQSVIVDDEEVGEQGVKEHEELEDFIALEENDFRFGNLW